MNSVEPEYGPPSRVARVQWISDDECDFYLEYRNGLTASVSVTEPIGVRHGSVVLVRDDAIDLAPDDLWPLEPSVGVVRRVLGDRALVAVRSDIRLVDITVDTCHEGNTVEVDDLAGIVAVLHEKPVTILEPLPEDDVSIAHFKPTATPEGLDYSDFAGLDEVKRRAYELVELPLAQRGSLAKIQARPIKGVLFTGLPGTGKTMLARIIASRSDATFYEISGPQVFSKWFGESEAILRAIFADASRQDRAIVFFDEIDSVAPDRASDSHEASRRVVAQLLTEMDGFSADDNVIVIAATNRPEHLDFALMRPGRFDWQIEFPLPSLEDRAEILEISSRHLQTSDHLPHPEVAARTRGWSSAELTAIWSEAALLAVSESRDRILEEDYFGGVDRVSAQRLVRTARTSKPASE